MDYEKKYKEALERAQQIKDGKDEWRYSDLAEITPVLTEIFPELAESEDERIRKDLMAFLINMKNGDFGCFPSRSLYQRWIDWLEKQKEQKPIVMNTPRYSPPEQKQEWSEEDDRIRRNLMSLLVNMRVDKRIAEDTYQKYYPWLKSLKNRGNFPKSNTNSPHWKPSEEQIKFLEDRLGSYMSIGENRILKSLIGDLKKLKED